MARRKLLQRKEPVITFLEENLLTQVDWMWITSVYRNSKYTILYKGGEHIFINPAEENSGKISEIIPELLKQRFLNRKTEKLLDEIKKLSDEKTSNCLLMIWHEWRKKVEKLELHNQAEGILKQARSRRLYYKAKKNKEIIKEVFYIDFGVYDKKVEADYQKGAENAFMYGYLLGIEECMKCGSG